MKSGEQKLGEDLFREIIKENMNILICIKMYYFCTSKPIVNKMKANKLRSTICHK